MRIFICIGVLCKTNAKSVKQMQKAKNEQDFVRFAEKYSDRSVSAEHVGVP